MNLTMVILQGCYAYEFVYVLVAMTTESVIYIISSISLRVSLVMKLSYSETSVFSFQDSKLEEWAEKVNSELENIENFELSVEG